MGRNYTAEVWPLGTVFDGNTRYTVPEYQRPYAWRPERAEALWEDLMGSYLHDPDSRKDEYMLGSLVLVKQKPNMYDVVDGQQRLVTLALMLCALRDSLESHRASVDDASDLDNAIREINYSLNLGKELILLNDGRDMGVFDSIRKSAGMRKSAVALYRNYSRLRTYADELCKRCGIGEPQNHKSGIHQFHRILSELKYRISFVCVSIDDEDRSNQYQIFESLNSKGQILHQADLIKNYVLKSVEPEQREETGKRWDNIMRKFVLAGRSEGRNMTPDDIIYYSMQSRFAKGVEDVQRRALYEAVKTAYKGPDIAEYLGQLEEDVGFVKAVNHPKYVPMPAKLRHACHGLRQIRAGYFKRPLIAACREWGLEDPRTSDLADCLVKFFFVYRTICKKDIDPLKRNARLMTAQIVDGQGLDRVLWTLLKHRTASGERDYADMGEFEAAFGDAVFDVSDDVAKYMLVSFERALQCQADADTTELEIERIFPQKPHSERWPDAAELAADVYRLGNATLLEKGWRSILQQYSFADKKNGVRTRKSGVKSADGKVGYACSRLQINQKYLAEYNRWTTAEIAEREGRLKALATSVWNLDAYARTARAPP